MDEIIRLEDEQQVQFERIEKSLGSETLTLFCCCAAFDVGYFPNLVHTGGTGKKWLSYKKMLRVKGKGTKTFREGVTDLLKVFGDEVGGEEIPKILQQERKRKPSATEVGTSDQVSAWGRGGAQNPYTKADYDRLDYFYNTLTDRLMSAGGVDNQQELILRKVAELYLEEEKYRAEGNIGDAQKCVKMALDLLSSEQLQKKDAKPVEDLRLDSIVDALEKWGAVEDGKILSFSELTEFLLKQLGRLGGKPAHRYTQTLDAADYELLFIQNCMAQNEDLPKWMELPDNMRFSEEVANEFSDVKSDDEKRAYEGIGIVETRAKGKRKRKGKG